MSTSTEVAKALLDIEAISLRPKKPFTWTSGIKSPIYCDNRLTMSYPKVRRLIANAFAEAIRTHYPEVEVIAGTATAGIPHAAWVAEILDLPMVYIRNSARKHGKGKQIEGVLNANDKVVVIEDLISTGGSAINAVDIAKEAGANVLGVVAIFSYELPKGIKVFNENNIEVHTLTVYTDLIDVAVSEGKILQENVEKLNNWRENPEKSYFV